MSFDWAEFVTLAQHLKDQNNEASHRSAISRAYYGVFCQARNCLEAQDPTTNFRDGGDVHSKVWRTYMNQGRTHSAIGTAGLRLRDLRNTADYHDEIDKLGEKLTQSFFEVDKIVQYLNQIQKHS